MRSTGERCEKGTLSDQQFCLRPLTLSSPRMRGSSSPGVHIFDAGGTRSRSCRCAANRDDTEPRLQATTAEKTASPCAPDGSPHKAGTARSERKTRCEQQFCLLPITLSSPRMRGSSSPGVHICDAGGTRSRSCRSAPNRDDMEPRLQATTAQPFTPAYRPGLQCPRPCRSWRIAGRRGPWRRPTSHPSAPLPPAHRR